MGSGVITRNIDFPTPNYQMLFESVPGRYLAIANDFTVIAASDAYLRERAKNRDEVEGHKVFGVFSEEKNEVSELKDSLEKVIKNHIADSMPLKQTIKMENGLAKEYCWKRTNFPIMDSQGNVVSIIHCMEDVTAEMNFFSRKKKAENSAIFLKNIINHVADPIFVKDKQHRWIDGNTAFIKLMGKPENEIFGKNDYDFFPKEQAEIFWEKDEEVFKTSLENINIESLTDINGETHILSTKKTCFQDPEGDPILVGIIRDITEITHMQEQLKESGHAYLRGIIDNSLDAIITMDQQGLVTEWNRQAEIIFGWSYQEAVGQKLAEMIIPPEYRKEHYAGIQRLLKDGTAPILNKRIELTGLNRNGNIFPIELSVTAQKQLDSYYFTAFVRDITLRKQIERFKGLLAAIVESTDDAIISRALDNHITSWNIGATKLFGFKAEEIIGQDFYILIPEELWEEEKDIIEKVRRGIPVKNFETRRLHKDGHLIDVSLTASPIYDNTGKITGYSKLVRDITEQKKTEMQIIDYTAALERSNKELDDFAYIASHDLKEPLRGINNYSQFLLEDNQDKLDKESVQRLERLVYLSKRMERLINDLLYFSRLGRQELAIQPTDINMIIKDIEITLEIFLKENNAKILIPKPLPVITCDKVKITEAFHNLITNAVKYNDNTEKIIEIGFLNKSTSKEKTEIRNVFYVKDNGRGIPDKFYNEIFRIFKRLQSSKDEEGSGVGLTFIKKIIERHGGKIWLESKLKEGTIFYFTLEK